MASKRERREVRREFIKSAGKNETGKISLKIKRDDDDTPEISHSTYPSFYLHDVKLPVGKNDVGKILKANVTLKFTNYGEDNSVKKDGNSFSFDVQDIEFIKG